MQAMDPVEAPAGFIEHVGQAVSSRLAQGVDLIGKSPGIQFVGIQHAGRRKAAGDQVLELIAGIVPAAAGVDIGGIRHRPVKGAAVALVAYHIQEGIVAATLLLHEDQQIVGVGSIGLWIDLEGQRAEIPAFRLKDVAPRPVET